MVGERGHDPTTVEENAPFVGSRDRVSREGVNAAELARIQRNARFSRQLDYRFLIGLARVEREP